jgi:hypothetical protein
MSLEVYWVNKLAETTTPTGVQLVFLTSGTRVEDKSVVIWSGLPRRTGMLQARFDMRRCAVRRLMSGTAASGTPVLSTFLTNASVCTADRQGR